MELGVSWVKVTSAKNRFFTLLPIQPLFIDRFISYLVEKLLA
jgi:hypothetical protein